MATTLEARVPRRLEKRERVRQNPARIAAINAAIPGAGNKGGLQAGRARYRNAAA